jgi:hypothetical protein
VEGEGVKVRVEWEWGSSAPAVAAGGPAAGAGPGVWAGSDITGATTEPVVVVEAVEAADTEAEDEAVVGVEVEGVEDAVTIWSEAAAAMLAWRCSSW